MVPGERTDLALGFDLTRVMNSGIAFGLFSGGDDALVIAFTAVSLGLIVGWFAFDTTRPGLWLGVGLLAGGALGNLADRVRDGAVTDFFDPPLWPAFNFADVAITVGVFVIALTALRAGAGAGRGAVSRRRGSSSSTTASRWSTSRPAWSSTPPRATAARRWWTRSATCWAAARRAGRGIVHRLDKDTSRADGRRPRRRGAPAALGDGQARTRSSASTWR